MTATARQPLDALADAAARLGALYAPAKRIGEAARAGGPGTLKELGSGTPMGRTDVADGGAMQEAGGYLIGYAVKDAEGVYDWVDDELGEA